MRVIVKKGALEEVLLKIINEDRSYRSAGIDTIVGADDDEPIEPTPQMAVQLSVDKPPVDDPAYMPSNVEELGRAASVISAEVPSDQIEFFYRKLHRLLDSTLDRHDAKTYEQSLSESKFREKVRLILEDDDDDLDDIKLAIEDPVSETADKIVDYIVANPSFFQDIVGLDPETGKPITRAAEPQLVQLRVLSQMQKNSVIQNILRKSELSEDEKKNVRVAVANEMLRFAKREVTPEEVSGYIEAGKAETAARVPAKEMVKVRKETGFEGLELIAALRDRADEMEAMGMEDNAKGLRKLADETEQEITHPEESVDPIAAMEKINPHEAAKIRKQLRDEILEKEGIDLKMSQQALQALKEKIADETGLKVNNIQNILYDDLKVFGFNPEDAMKLGFPTEKKIPSTYDPMKIIAQKKIVGAVYDLFRSTMRDYIESIGYDNEDEASVLASLLDDDSATFPGDGIDGYVKVQNTAVVPRDMDPDSQQYISVRNSFEAVVAFIQGVAKAILDPEKIKGAKEGGIRAFMQQMNADDAFRRQSSDEVLTTQNFEQYMNGLIDNIQNVILDENIAYNILEKALKTAPKRTKKFLRK